MAYQRSVSFALEEDKNAVQGSVKQKSVRHSISGLFLSEDKNAVLDSSDSATDQQRLDLIAQQEKEATERKTVDPIAAFRDHHASMERLGSLHDFHPNSRHAQARQEVASKPVHQDSEQVLIQKKKAAAKARRKQYGRDVHAPSDHEDHKEDEEYFQEAVQTSTVDGAHEKAHGEDLEHDNQKIDPMLEHIRTIWPRWRITCYRISESVWFKVFCTLVILTNAIFMCVEVSNPVHTYDWVEVASHTCTVWFTVEFIVRVAGNPNHFLHSGWLVFDAFILACVALQLMLTQLIHLANGEPEKNNNYMRLLRSFQLLRLMRLFRLSKVFSGWRPLRVILRAVSKAWENVLAAIVFIGIQWLAFAVLSSSFFGYVKHTEEDEQVAYILKRYFGTVARSFITALEATLGGVEWGEDILYPLFKTGKSYYVFAGVGLLASILFSTFCLCNLVLGIYVRQVIDIASDYDAELEHQDLLLGESRVHEMRTLLRSIDEDGDDMISTQEVQEYIMDDPAALETLGIGSEEMEVLHAALDTEGTGLVGVSELLFGVLKLAGTSKTIDMLSIDYRQKVFLRDITELEQSSVEELGRLSSFLEKVVFSTTQLQQEMQQLKVGIDKAKGNLIAEIEREDAQLDEAQRDAADAVELDEARRLERNAEARNAIEEHLDFVKAQVAELVQARRLEALCGGSRKDAELLQTAVRKRLETQLGPWLKWEIEEAGGLR